MADEGLLRGLLANLSAEHHRSTDDTGIYLWAVVRDLLGIGSTAAAELCMRFGFNPDLYVLEPVWLDGKKVVANWCDIHECTYGIYDSCDDCVNDDI